MGSEAPPGASPLLDGDPMKDTKQAQQMYAETDREEASNPTAEVRTLSELELALAGGGDDVVTWP